MPEIIASTYEIIQEIGSGGLGTVFLANHLRLKKKVVLKAEKRKIKTSSEFLRREVDVLKELNHPYIPKVYDFFEVEENSTVYTVMDYIEGESLDKPLKRHETFTQLQIIEWAKQLLEALDYLHSPIHGKPPRGFVHSDIKPANLMKTKSGNICLIDFNIALALGEENVIGLSAGYASPEHYGLDYSSGILLQNNKKTVLINDCETEKLPGGQPSSNTPAPPSAQGSIRKIVPDVRSDIYSAGATIYHLLSGRHPAKSALEVVPLSENEFDPQIVKIISKAMNPNPDLRYQSAAEMLYDFEHLRDNAPELIRLKREFAPVTASLAVLFIIGLLSAFIGLKRMQTTESWLKFAEYSKNALDAGNSELAVEYALQALPLKSDIFTPPAAASAQNALTEALGVYNLSDGFKTYKTLELPSAPLYMSVSPDGKMCACVYSGNVAVIDIISAKIISSFPACESALSEVEFIDSNVIVYAGKDGIKAYNIQQGSELWTGEPATAISVSKDGKFAAAVYRDNNYAVVYNAVTGEIVHRIEFGEKHQNIIFNDTFANPNNNLFDLNENGTLLAVSFSDGSFILYNLIDSENMELYNNSSGITSFQGGFYGNYLAFAASIQSNSQLVVIDYKKMLQTVSLYSENKYNIKINDSGIYLSKNNILARINPETGEITGLAKTSKTIKSFYVNENYSLVSEQDKFSFYNENAKVIADYKSEYSADFLLISNAAAIVGFSDSPVLRILKYENYSENEIFSYDNVYKHSEARLSADRKNVMLFYNEKFVIFDIDGTLINETDIPEPEQIYDYQFVREGNESCLKVTYYSGKVSVYSAADGTLIREETTEKPDKNIFEDFYTDKLHIECPLHGTPTAYDINTGEFVAELEKDAYITYITQVEDNIIAQYMTTDKYFYGILMNEKCEKLAELPYLCDIIDGELVFDYPTGNMRISPVYNLDELIKLAENNYRKD